VHVLEEGLESRITEERRSMPEFFLGVQGDPDCGDVSAEFSMETMSRNLPKLQSFPSEELSQQLS